MGVVQSFVDKYKLKCNSAVHVGVPLQWEIDDYLRLGWRAAWVEANPVFYPFLDGLAVKHGHIVIKAGAGAEDTVLVFNVANDGQSSSFLPRGRHAAIYPGIQYVNQITVPVRRLDKLFDNQTPPWDFLYMDVQGYEGMVLVGCGNWLLSVQAIYLEFNDTEIYKGCWTTSQIIPYLSDRGFVVMEKNYVHPEWGDMLFLRK